jgi:hypothetical protein
MSKGSKDRVRNRKAFGAGWELVFGDKAAELPRFKLPKRCADCGRDVSEGDVWAIGLFGLRHLDCEAVAIRDSMLEYERSRQ